MGLAMNCARSSCEDTKGAMDPGSSGGGAPKRVNFLERACVMARFWDADCVRLKSTASALPSWGWML